MSTFLALPDWVPPWVPSWVPLVLLALAGLYGLALLFMPFAVLGVKSRLEAIEMRLDEIQGEIRSLALRLPEPLRGTADFDDSYVSPPAATPRPPNRADPRAEQVGPRPPIPPAGWQQQPERLAAVDRKLASVRRAEERRNEQRGGDERRVREADDDGLPRTEPRLNWPR